MLKKHTLSPNHKVVAGPHNYSAGGGSPGPGNMESRGSGMHPSAEPMGGGAQGPSDGMQGFADGGSYTGAPSMLDNVKAAVGTAVGDYVDKAKSAFTGVQKSNQDRLNKQVDDAERQAVTGDDQ
jgi:hypothetical protein